MQEILMIKSLNLEKIVKIISDNGGKARLVGGCVRDYVLRKDISDIDIATDLTPEKIQEIFLKEKIKVIPTGIDHGTLTIIYDSEIFEITTLRQDIETDGRHAKVKFTDNFEIDASRRDFTINALSYDIHEQKLYDYFGGIDDLENKIVKFIGNPEERIQEDYLRILRFFRFSIYYSDDFNEDALKACRDLSRGLKNISKERVNIELIKILRCRKNLSNLFSKLENSLVLKFIFSSEIDITGICNFENKFEKYHKYSNNITHLRLAFLLFSIGQKNINDLLKENKFSNKDSKLIIEIITFINTIIDMEDKKDILFEVCKIWYYKKYLINDILLAVLILSRIDEDSFYTNINFMQKNAPRMPFSSLEIMETGYSGLALGNRIRYLEKKWIESGFSISYDELINFKEITDARNQNK